MSKFLVAGESSDRQPHPHSIKGTPGSWHVTGAEQCGRQSSRVTYAWAQLPLPNPSPSLPWFPLNALRSSCHQLVVPNLWGCPVCWLTLHIISTGPQAPRYLANHYCGCVWKGAFCMTITFESVGHIQQMALQWGGSHPIRWKSWQNRRQNLPK